jgi:hypothetical protein
MNIFQRITDWVKTHLFSWQKKPDVVTYIKLETPWYFLFEIPTMPDGTVVSYSPGYCGEPCPLSNKKKAIYYNDKELWGIGECWDEKFPSDIEPLSKEDVDKILAEAKEEEGIFFGEKINSRYEVSVEEDKYEPEIHVENEVYIPQPRKLKAKFQSLEKDNL